MSPCILAIGALRKQSCLLKVDCFPLKSAGSNSRPFNCVVSMKWCVRYFLSLQSLYPSYLEWLPQSFSFPFFIHSFICRQLLGESHMSLQLWPWALQAACLHSKPSPATAWEHSRFSITSPHPSFLICKGVLLEHPSQRFVRSKRVTCTRHMERELKGFWIHNIKSPL